MRIRHIVAGILILSLGGCGYAAWKYIDVIAHPVVALDVASCVGIPAAASHIFVRKSSIGADFKFKIDEGSFMEWAKEKKFDDLGIRSSNGTYNRPDWRHIQVHINDEISDSVTIEDGLYFQRREPNGGGYTAAFDRKTGWAYYTWSTH